MSWINNLKIKFLFIICVVLLVLFIGFLFNSLLENKITELIKNYPSTNIKQPEPIRKFSEISPDGLREIILYERPFTGRSEHEYGNYLNNQHLFVVKQFNPWVEHEIYIGDDHVGYPHWLGNDFIFFTGGVCTGCRGFYLVNINSKQSYNGVITTTPITKDGFTTHLKDWFGEEFEFAGYDENIRSVSLNGKTYLIFEMWNNNKYIGEKKFIFTGNSLKEE